MVIRKCLRLLTIQFNEQNIQESLTHSVSFKILICSQNLEALKQIHFPDSKVLIRDVQDSD
jgi:hypothetical protein